MTGLARGAAGTSRWQTAYDVLVGVVLFVALLLPAVRQAATGTPAGLRHAAALFLLGIVVLVLVSRHMTRPGRHVAAAVPAPVAATDPADPLVALGLILSDDEIAVRQDAAESAGTARLTWADCAAVVSSRVGMPHGESFRYLQFVATHEARIRPPHHLARARGLAALLGGVTPTAATMVWPVPDTMGDLPDRVLDHVERTHPHVRIVRPDPPG